MTSSLSNSAIQLKDFLDRVRRALRSAFSDAVWVLAEVQAIKVSDRSHVYLTLVDVHGHSQTKGNLWHTQGAQRLQELERARGEKLAKGEKVFILCRPEYHPTYGFSLNVDDIRFADTLGPAERFLRQAVNRLKHEGLISRNRDLAVPEMILRVAVVAPKGAEGLLDFQRILFDARPHAPLLQTFYATFQGEAAAQEICSAIDQACIWRPDVIVLARGGGSKADLLYLNNYSIGRSICDCHIPVWSGIGHSTDQTLVDLVAQKSFKTPSDAAHQIINVIQVTLGQFREINSQALRIISGITTRAEHALQRDWTAVKRNAGASLEMSALKTKEAATTASSCSRIVIEIWGGHITICRQNLVAAGFGAISKAKLVAREQAHMSASASRLLIERRVSVVGAQRVVALNATNNLIREQNRRALVSYNACIASAKFGLTHLRQNIARLRQSIVSCTELCLKRLSSRLQGCWEEPKQTVDSTLARAAVGVRQRASTMKSLLNVKIRSAELELHRAFDASCRICCFMLAQRKSAVGSQMTLASHFAAAVIVKGQIAQDRLKAAIESADIQGPLARGFVMVTDIKGRWLRAASDTVQHMKLVYKGGTVRVRKDENGNERA